MSIRMNNALTKDPSSRIRGRVYGALGGTGILASSLLCVLFWLPEEATTDAAPARAAFQETTWPMSKDAKPWVDEKALRDLADLVGGAGFVAHQGKGLFRWGFDHRPRYVASVKKSLISALMLQAVDQGLIAGVDDRVAKFEPRLGELNGGVDAGITWRQLACMTSGYGLIEPPGAAFAYNDYAVALWYDVLMDKVYREKGTAVLRRQLAEPLGFEDAVTFQAFGVTGFEPKLRISARDLARFGQLILEGGVRGGRAILSKASMATLLGSVVPVSLPLTSGELAEMLPGQKTVGGTWNISPIGPGRYTCHLWLNKRGPRHLLMLPDAPEDTLLASGKWGEAVLWIIPSLQLVVAWNGSEIGDHHLARDHPDAEMNAAARLIVKAVAAAPRVSK
jgi:CubicO group peptidase (beta-lactamase class C family)